MDLLDEYRRQSAWRDWQRALSLCPVLPGQQVLDLGCGPGEISAQLSARGVSVLGIDGNADLLAAAKLRCPECRFEKHDLLSLGLTPAAFDGIWSSFTAAYFVDFGRTFARWSSFLKPRAWVCVIDIDDLLGHEPLSDDTNRRIAAFYEEAAGSRRYDFRMGRKIEPILSSQGFQVASVTLDDRELSFEGPAGEDVVQAWKDRFARMGGLKSFFGNEFPTFQDEFIRCISMKSHRSRCKVVCSVGVRT